MESTKLQTLHMIGNAHLDPVWLWTWQEGFQEAKATFRSVLDLMTEDDDFLFTSSSAALYEWVEQNDPAMFEEIRQRVTEGRWEIVGGWWIQPDCNLPNGESFVRQGLYGQRYFRQKLGVRATVGYNVDSFGHAGSLPQILLKSGMSSYVFSRPHPHEQRLPSRLFWWKSGDGSRVLTYRIPYEYSSWGKDLRQHVARCAAEFHGAIDQLMCFYGVGNHGGGPTRDNIESIRELNADPRYPTLTLSTPSRYFEALRAKGPDLPVVHDELQHHAVGCYSAHSAVKRWNRQSENALMVSERLSSIAARVTGLPYPSDFPRAWKNVLFNQFHDILAGTSIEQAYEDAHYLYGEAMAIASRNLNAAIQSISWKIDIAAEEGARPIVVFNPHSWVARVPVELEFGRVRDGDVLVNSEGRCVPMQTMRPQATVSSGSRSRLTFLAELPPLGYEVYRVIQRERADTPPTLDADDVSLESARFRLEIDPQTGWLKSLYDKLIGFEWLRGPAARPLVLSDTSDTWSHGVTHYDEVIGEFVARSVKLVEHGPVKSVIRVESAYGRSSIVQEIAMYPMLDRIDVRVTVDWHEQLKLLKLSFPINVFYSTATFEAPYGFIERTANQGEEPGQRWVDLTGIGRNLGDRVGMSILNDGKYSFDVSEKEIRMTVLRSPIYAHHDPYVPQPDCLYSFTDQGLQTFTYALLPHTGGWQEAGTVRRAAELNEPAVAQVESHHAGPLPQRGSYIAVDQDNVDVTVLKRAEDGDDLILRCYETAGVPAAVTISLPAWNREIEAQLRPSEIKTFRIPVELGMPVVETNLIECDE